MIQFLEDHRIHHEKLRQKKDVYLADWQAKEYQKIAKQYDAQRYFTIYACQSCINKLVKFVWDNYTKQLEQQAINEIEENGEKQTESTI